MRSAHRWQYSIVYLLLAGLVPHIAQAQVISITFSATIDGNQVPIDSIWVKNVTAGGDTMLHAPDTVLFLANTTGLADALRLGWGGLRMSKAVPNPFDGSTRFQVIVQDEGDLILTVRDALGRSLTSSQRIVGPGIHSYTLGGGPQGVLLVEAQWNEQRVVQRLLNITGGYPAMLQQTGSDLMPDDGRMKNGWGTWQMGDSLFYIVFATGPFGYVFSASDGANLTGPATPLLDLLPGVVCAQEPIVADIDGNLYPVVQIGGQCWMAANLRTTRYRNGTTIPSIGEPGMWAETGVWCDYENNPANAGIHGKLYTWWTATHPSGLCPLGWHVPTDAEWQTLEAGLGMPLDQLNGYLYFRGAAQNVGGKMKSTGTLQQATGPWYAPNSGANNASGFSGLPSGGYFDLAQFTGIEATGFWWTSSETGSATAWSRHVSFNEAGVSRLYELHKWDALSVRCLRDQSDCTGLLYGNAYLDNCGNCVGGTTGLPPCSQDCAGDWGGSALPGTPCNDGNPSTLNDSYGSDCICAGQVFDCEGVLGGPALPGTACDDGNANTIEDVYGSDCSCAGSICPALVVDIDGNGYPVAQIGGQCWMARNLKTTRYRNGNDIPHVTNVNAWNNLSTPAWANYNNDSVNDVTYGKVYNWYAAAHPEICPLGWHVPTEAEWQVLEATLGMPAGELGNWDYRGITQNVGGKLKSTSPLWSPPNAGANNESDFSGLPSGQLNSPNNWFVGIGSLEWYWTSTAYNVYYAYGRQLSFDSAGIERNTPVKGNGFCLRCIKD